MKSILSIESSSCCRSQKLHIADTEATPILSTDSDSKSLTSLSQAIVSSNATIDHLGLGRIRNVHARYANGEVVQTALFHDKTGVTATVAGKEVRRSLEIEKILGVIHKVLNGSEEIDGDGADGEGGQIKSPQENVGAS